MAAISYPKAYMPKGFVKQLTSAEVSEKKFNLPESAEYPSLVRLIPRGGPEQFPGIDFDVSGNVLSWSQMGLDGFLEQGDTLLVRY